MADSTLTVGHRIGEFLASAHFTTALALSIVGTAFLTHALHSVIGWPGLIGVLGALTVISAASFIAQRRYIEWHGLLPISLIAFMAWCGISLFWSSYLTFSILGFGYQVIWAFLGIYIALVRDAVQVVRLIGDVLRVLLAASLALEIFAGLIIDHPIKALGISGDIAYGGPIQGLFGSRNQLSIVALIAFVTFVVEAATRSVTRSMTALSIGLAVLCILLAHSPVIAAVSVVVGLATLALFGIRHVKTASRRLLQWLLGILALAVIALVYVYRIQAINLLNARSDFSVRYDVWIQIWQLIPVEQLGGWGWVGRWPVDVFPFDVINANIASPQDNALNAYLDVYLQVGFVGVLLFAVLIALAFGRSWLLASNKRTVTWAWAPLVLIALLTTSLFESSILTDSGWMLLVVCAVQAARGMSWRNALPRAPLRPAGPPPVAGSGTGRPTQPKATT